MQIATRFFVLDLFNGEWLFAFGCRPARLTPHAFNQQPNPNRGTPHQTSTLPFGQSPFEF